MWVKTVEAGSLAEGVPHRVKAETLSLCLIKKGEGWYALSNLCPHLGCAMHKGSLEGYELKCPCHDWIFDIRSGEFITAPEIRLDTYKTKVMDGWLYINKEG